MKNNQQQIIDFSDARNKTFLVSGYRGKRQLDWILGKKDSRDSKLFSVQFSPIRLSQRNGSVSSGELPDYVIIYDSADIERQKIIIFNCLSYSILSQKEMEVNKYPNPCGSYIVYELGEEYIAENLNIKQLEKYSYQKYPDLEKCPKTMPYIVSGTDILASIRGQMPLIRQETEYRMVDLFAGLGGFHHALKKLAKEMGLTVESVFVSELKADLRNLYSKNYGVDYLSINTDITLLSDDDKIIENVPEHEILCGGFPCQPFSKAGKQEGFDDKEGRGILFNYIADIIRVRRPKYILLENVANLLSHDEGNTWRVICERLSNSELNGGLNYDIQAKVISPHEYGFPQYRKRIYIVGIDRLQGNLDLFKWPTKPVKATCDISSIMEKVPTEPQPIKDVYQHYIAVWQQFLNLCIEHHAKLPSAPIWAMEFGANYEFEYKAPAYQTLKQLRGKCGKLGDVVCGNSIDECVAQLPNYAQTKKSEVFPDWKIKFIKENRKFYEDNKIWIDIWKNQIRGWDNSFMKFEWNCDEDGVMNINNKILQFRPSGLRVKRPTYSPALTYMNSQVPIFPGATYTDENGETIQGRYMTMTEAARVQGMGELSFEGLKKSRIYEALGNAVDVEIVKLIAKNLIKCVDN